MGRSYADVERTPRYHGDPDQRRDRQGLREIRTLMEFAGEPFFKFMAYERAAETLENARAARRGRRRGAAHRAAGRRQDDRRPHREDRADRDRPYLEELRARYPSTLMEVLGVQASG